VSVFVLSLLVFGRGLHYFGTFFRGIVDARTYYLKAHSIVFDRDLSIANDLADSPERPPDRPAPATTRTRGDRRVSRPSKFPIGLSLFEVPLIVVARAVRGGVASFGLTGPVAAGFSDLELVTVAVGLVAAFSASMALVYAVMSAEFGAIPALIGLACGWFGTSLFYYSAVFPFMAHAVSFGALAVVLWTSRELRRPGPVNTTLMLLGVALGAEYLVRPQQSLIAVCLLPFLVQVLRGRPRHEWLSGACVTAALACGALGLQTVENYRQSGAWALTSYRLAGEGFSFTHPQLGVVLLDPKVGLLRFVPVVVMAALGYGLALRRIPNYVWPSVANAVAQIYVIACWWAPMQGDSFGARMWCDNAVVVMIGTAALFATVSGRRWVAALTTCGATVTWTTYQMSRYIDWIR
jgi:hypothetical protein